LVPAVDVATEGLEHLECERQARRGAADLAEIDLHRDREVHRRSLLDLDADDRAAGAADRPERHLLELRPATQADPPRGRGLRGDEAAEIADPTNGRAVDGDDHVAR